MNKCSWTQITVWWLPEGRWEQVAEGKGSHIYGDRRDLTLDAGHAMQYTDHVSKNCTLETYVIS